MPSNSESKTTVKPYQSELGHDILTLGSTAEDKFEATVTDKGGRVIGNATGKTEQEAKDKAESGWWW